MNVASLEPCQELYELSGWRPDDWDVSYWEEPKYGRYIAPKYTLGYLMRKLPYEVRDDQGRLYRLRAGKNQYYYFEYQFSGSIAPMLWWNISPFASKPEDAAAKLAIELFKQGVLTKEDS